MPYFDTFISRNRCKLKLLERVPRNTLHRTRMGIFYRDTVRKAICTSPDLERTVGSCTHHATSGGIDAKCHYFRPSRAQILGADTHKLLEVPLVVRCHMELCSGLSCSLREVGEVSHPKSQNRTPSSQKSQLCPSPNCFLSTLLRRPWRTQGSGHPLVE